MGLKTIGAKMFAKRIHSQTQKWLADPVETQKKVFHELIEKAKLTKFGQQHDFKKIKTHENFVSNVPVRDYEDIKPYVEDVLKGKSDILWPGKPIYFAKTSGTTSGAKYIPITDISMKEQVRASRNALLAYVHETGNASFLKGKMIFLQGSPELQEKNGIKLGRLSGISAHYVPGYLLKNRLPSWETNCLEDWETKIEAIIDETIHEDMRVIAGIPSWVQMYFERLASRSGKKVCDIFPNFQLFVYGGVNYEPYRAKFEELMGKSVDSVELFPASEGFFAYQDSQKEKGLLLLLNSGIFYEFIKADEFFDPDTKRLTIGEVELGVNYVMIISTNAGLWAYNLGDTVQFISLKPHRVVVSGRIKHFISAFGEHVIAKEVEYAMKVAIDKTGAQVNEFTVAPQITPHEGLPYHEWFIEFEKEPSDMNMFTEQLDVTLQKQNSYYFDLIEGKILQRLKVKSVQKGGFSAFMKSKGKLGGQNKVQRLANDRSLADGLKKWIL